MPILVFSMNFLLLFFLNERHCQFGQAKLYVRSYDVLKYAFKTNGKNQFKQNRSGKKGTPKNGNTHTHTHTLTYTGTSMVSEVRDMR